jgi:hypothetical protein
MTAQRGPTECLRIFFSRVVFLAFFQVHRIMAKLSALLQISSAESHVVALNSGSN